MHPSQLSDAATGPEKFGRRAALAGGEDKRALAAVPAGSATSRKAAQNLFLRGAVHTIPARVHHHAGQGISRERGSAQGVSQVHYLE